MNPKAKAVLVVFLAGVLTLVFGTLLRSLEKEL